MATVSSAPEDLGVPADFTEQTPQITINAEVHKMDQTPKAATSTALDQLTPKAATSTALSEEEGEIQVMKVVEDDVTLLKEYVGPDVVAE